MGFGEPEKAPPIILQQTEQPKPQVQEHTPITLGPLSAEVEIEAVPVGEERTIEVAKPWLRNGSGALITTLLSPRTTMSRPSAFRDQLGLDPDPVLEASEARAFELASPVSRRITDKDEGHPITIRFRPERLGQHSSILEIKVVGADGSIDSKQLRLIGTGAESKTPKIVNTITKPDPTGAIDGTESGESAPMPEAHSFDHAATLAQIHATGLARQQQEGVKLGASEITAYSKKPPPVSAMDQLVELALLMGVSGIAGVVAKYVAKHVAQALARPIVAPPGGTRFEAPYMPGKAPNPKLEVTPPQSSGDQLATMTADSLKEGLKGGAKIAVKAAKGGSSATPGSGGALSHNWQLDFIARHAKMMAQLETEYLTGVAGFKERMKDSEHGAVVMEVIARGLNAASATAMGLQARTMELQWVATVARHSLGEEETRLPDGSSAITTKLDPALDYGERGWYKETSVPKHDGVLDIHVDLPKGTIPVEQSGFRVRGASIVGVSQEVAEKLKTTKLAAAAIPIRLIVQGHPALITRDEVGRVRVNGYLLTENGPHWTEAHMHKAASMLVNNVLAKTLADWGVKQIKTDDATGLEPPR